MHGYDPRSAASGALSALIFDVDGTLAETEEWHRRAFNRAFCEAGLDWYWDEPLYRRLLAVTGGKERMLRFIEDSAPHLMPDAAPLVARLHGRKTRLYADHVRRGTIPLRPGIRQLVDAARHAGLRLAIATTTSVGNVAALLESAFGPEWTRLFPVVAAGDMVSRKKPAPDVYALALDRLELPASACIAIEDSRNGLEAARAAGLRVACVRSTFTRDDDLGAATALFETSEALTFDVLLALARRG